MRVTCLLMLLLGCGGKVVADTNDAVVDLSPEPEPGGIVAGVESRIAAGGVHTCAIVDGGVRCVGEVNGSSNTRAVKIDGVSNAKQIVAGSAFTCVRMTNGTVRCFGNNDGGQLGDGTRISRTSWVRVRTLTNVAEIAAGAYHACARHVDGTVSCWGLGYDGQLGQLAEVGAADAPIAVKVKGLSGVTAIAAGWTHTCAVTAAGVQCWGANHRGQLGDGTLRGGPAPRPVVGLTGAVTSISSGEDHNCVRLDGGAVMCWGRNYDGQIGDGGEANRTSATRISINDATAVSLGKLHSCALHASGSVSCWGANKVGQLGVGDNTPSRTPRRVVIDQPVTALDIGHDHGCLLSGSKFFCFGEGAEGRLGTGDGSDRSAPVAATF